MARGGDPPAQFLTIPRDVHGLHAGAWDHHLPGHDLAEVQHGLHDPHLVGGKLPVAVGQCQHQVEVLLRHGGAPAAHPSEHPGQGAEHPRRRAQQHVENVEGADDLPGQRLRVELCQGLRRDLAEDQDPEGHQADHGGQVALAAQVVRQGRRQGGSRHVDQVVPDEDRDQELLGCGGPPFEPCPFQTVAALAETFETGQ